MNRAIFCWEHGRFLPCPMCKHRGDLEKRFVKLVSDCTFTLLGTRAFYHTRVLYHIGNDDNRFWLQVKWWGKDSGTGECGMLHDRKWFLSEHMTDSEIVQTVFMATMAVMEHETREEFKYKGQPIFCPHYNVEILHLLHEIEQKPGHLGVTTPILDTRHVPPSE